MLPAWQKPRAANKFDEVFTIFVHPCLLAVVLAFLL
jgi:hypothetical protein